MCGDFLCGGITWVLGGTEECKGEDYRKVTPNQLTMEGNHKNIMVELESGEARPKYSTGSNILVANERFE